MRPITALLLVLLVLTGEARAQAAASPAVTVETRAVPGRDVKQVIGQARLPAPPHVLRAVIATSPAIPPSCPT